MLFPMEKNLYLYSAHYCPFCIRVELFMKEHNINLPIRYLDEKPEYRNELKEIGGKTQIPCLIINQSPLYESEDIMIWLSKNYIKQHSAS